MNTSLIIEKVIVFQNKELTWYRSYAIIQHREWSDEHTFDKVGKQISTNQISFVNNLCINENQSRLGIQLIICDL